MLRTTRLNSGSVPMMMPMFCISTHSKVRLEAQVPAACAVAGAAGSSVRASAAKPATNNWIERPDLAPRPAGWRVLALSAPGRAALRRVAMGVGLCRSPIIFSVLQV